MLRPKGLDHVGLTVTDMDRSLRFYRDGLALELLRESGPNADGVRSAVLRVGGQELNVFSSTGLAPAATEHRAGMDHFCLEMDAASIHDVVAGLREVGVEIVRGPVERRDGVSVFVQDPDGVRVELRLARPPEDSRG